MVDSNDQQSGKEMNEAQGAEAPQLPVGPNRKIVVAFVVAVLVSMWLGAAWGRPALDGLANLWAKATSGQRDSASDGMQGHDHAHGGQSL